MSDAMQTVRLADTGRVTTRLGYGCSSLMGANGKAASLRLLEEAFDAGFRHFDVAPMYGFGQAEACVGEFARVHRGAITVTTKFGIAPVPQRAWMGLARRLAGPAVKMMPALKKRMLRAAAAATGPAAHVAFTAEEARASLERSLAALGVEQIDVWLLHEVEAGDVRDGSLRRFLDDAVKSGKVGSFGVGSEAAKVAELQRTHPELCRVTQHEWSVMDATPAPDAGFSIRHRSLTENFRDLHATLARDGGMCARWSAETGADLADREVLARLMLRAALDANAEGIVLVSSKSAQHLKANAETLRDDSLRAPAAALHGCVQAERRQQGETR